MSNTDEASPVQGDVRQYLPRGYSVAVEEREHCVLLLLNTPMGTIAFDCAPRSTRALALRDLSDKLHNAPHERAAGGGPLDAVVMPQTEQRSER